MPTQEYRTLDGGRVGGVTYVIGQNLGWNKRPLMIWANKEGQAGRNLDYNRDRAATIGTHIHNMVEDHINELDPEGRIPWDELDHDQAEQVRRGYKNFQRWYAGNAIKVIATEVWGVSEEWETGWCPDALGVTQVLEPELCLFDWKSSKGTFADHLIQTSAYVRFVEEYLREGRDFNGGVVKDPDALAQYRKPDVQIDGVHIVRFGKDNGTFKHAFYDRELLDKGWVAFTHLRHLHALKYELEGAVR